MGFSTLLQTRSLTLSRTTKEKGWDHLKGTPNL